ncbi:MAG: response regulator, partial [Myxococcota bacterium]
MATEEERVLVVDDAADTIEVLRRNLELHGYRVSSAQSTAEAIVMLQKRPIDLVITDLKMPGASGLELVRHVRDNFRDVDVLMITGYPSVESAVSAVRSGAVNYLAKPFT